MDKQRFLPSLLACVLWSMVSPSVSQDDRSYWFTSYGEAIREARKTQKPIFLEFRCEP